jgi:hypothetical protein
MPNLIDGDMTGAVVDLIDHAIASLPDAISVIVSSQFFRPMRAWSGCQRRYLCDDSRAIGLRSNRLEFLARGGLNRELI